MTTTPNTFPTLLALTALVSICPTHTIKGKAVTNLDCGACGERQDAARVYLRTLVADGWGVVGS